jgi:hypothetical protein
MPDDVEKLRRATADLHDALQTAHDLDPETRKLLERTLAEVRAVLEGAAAPADAKADAGRAGAEQLPLRRQLAEAAAEFEGSHPTLAGTLRGVIDALAQIGI